MDLTCFSHIFSDNFATSRFLCYYCTSSPTISDSQTIHIYVRKATRKKCLLYSVHCFTGRMACNIYRKFNYSPRLEKTPEKWESKLNVALCMSTQRNVLPLENEPEIACNPFKKTRSSSNFRCKCKYSLPFRWMCKMGERKYIEMPHSVLINDSFVLKIQKIK